MEPDLACFGMALQKEQPLEVQQETTPWKSEVSWELGQAVSGHGTGVALRVLGFAQVATWPQTDKVIPTSPAGLRRQGPRVPEPGLLCPVPRYLSHTFSRARVGPAKLLCCFIHPALMLVLPVHRARPHPLPPDNRSTTGPHLMVTHTLR